MEKEKDKEVSGCFLLWKNLMSKKIHFFHILIFYFCALSQLTWETSNYSLQYYAFFAARNWKSM